MADPVNDLVECQVEGQQAEAAVGGEGAATILGRGLGRQKSSCCILGLALLILRLAQGVKPL
jgi:hypothetical protein